MWATSNRWFLLLPSLNDFIEKRYARIVGFSFNQCRSLLGLHRDQKPQNRELNSRLKNRENMDPGDLVTPQALHPNFILVKISFQDGVYQKVVLVYDLIYKVNLQTHKGFFSNPRWSANTQNSNPIAACTFAHALGLKLEQSPDPKTYKYIIKKTIKTWSYVQ